MVKNWVEDSRSASGHGYQTKGCRLLSKPDAKDNKAKQICNLRESSYLVIICIASILSLLLFSLFGLFQNTGSLAALAALNVRSVSKNVYLLYACQWGALFRLCLR